MRVAFARVVMRGPGAAFLRGPRAVIAPLGLAAAAVVCLAAPGGEAATATQTAPNKPAFKLLISPADTTAGQSTTFEVTVLNTSSPGTMLRSIELTAPTGFRLVGPGPKAPLRRRTVVVGRRLSLRQIAVAPGSKLQFLATATAPSQCGASLRRWTTRAFQGAAPFGSQLALQPAASRTGVTVVCPSTALCGGSGPACSTSLPKVAASTYSVVSNAGSGTLRQTVDVGRRLTCGTYRFRDSNWYNAAVTQPTAAPPPTGAPPILDQVSYAIKNTAASGIGFCLGAAYDFATASGGQAPAGSLPNGKPGFIGLLPMCIPAAPPCIKAISSQPDPNVSSGYDAVLSVQVPEQGDPWGSG